MPIELNLNVNPGTLSTELTIANPGIEIATEQTTQTIAADLDVISPTIAITAEIGSPTFTATMQLAADGEPGADGADGADGSVPDDEFNVMDISGILVNIFAGTPVDLGTGGTAILRWRRVGRSFDGYFQIEFKADHGDGAIGIYGPTLPFNPRLPEIVEIGNFCYCNVYETTPGAGDGFLFPVGSAVSNVGQPFPAVVFIQLSESLGDGGPNNLFIINSNPYNLAGREFLFCGRLRFEIDSAESP